MVARILLACADSREGEHVAAAGVGEVHVLGVGKTAAAARLAVALRDVPRLVLLFGICGAFPASALVTDAPALDVLDLCVVAESVLADEGAVTDDGFLGLASLGLGSEGPWRADDARSRRAAEHLDAPLVRAATVSSCSGTDRRSAAVAARSAAQVETMESAACAFVCAEHDVPLVEIRCVSNRTGARSAAGFRIRDAAVRAQQAVLDLLRTGVLA